MKKTGGSEKVCKANVTKYLEYSMANNTKYAGKQQKTRGLVIENKADKRYMGRPRQPAQIQMNF